MLARSVGTCRWSSHVYRLRPVRSITGLAPPQRSTEMSLGMALGRRTSPVRTKTSTSPTCASPRMVAAARMQLPLTSGHGTTWEVTSTFGRVTNSGRQDSGLGYGHDPAPAPLGVLGLLLHDLVGEVPRQDEHVVGHGAHQLVDVDDRQLGARHQ